MSKNASISEKCILEAYKTVEGASQKKRKFKKDQQELEDILQQEESFEKQINSPDRKVIDYRNYIDFKKRLFVRLANREGEKYLDNLKETIEPQINDIYIAGLNSFPNEISFWKEYICYCKLTQMLAAGTAAYEKLLSIHGDDEKFWLDAAEWECNETKNFEKAKNVLLLALEKHPDGLNFYLKLFKVLLSSANSEESADCGLALDVFKKTKNCSFPIEYWAKVLDIAEEYTFAKQFQKALLDHMTEGFPVNEFTWHKIAQRELKGYDTEKIRKKYTERGSAEENIEETYNSEGNSIDDQRSEKTYARRLELCSEVYELASKLMNTRVMWDYYIKTMLEFYEDSEIEEALKWRLLEKPITIAIQTQKISENHFDAYINILAEVKKDKILEVLEQGTSLFPNSALPWKKYLCYYIAEDKLVKVEEIFRRACQQLGDVGELASLWFIMLQYCQTYPSKHESIYELYWEACSHKSKEFMPFRVHYLQFCAIFRPQEMKDVYNKLAHLTPPYLELYRKMDSILSALIDPDISLWRKCHQDTVMFFGEQEVDIWNSYMKFERDHGDPTKVSKIYKEACATLTDKTDLIRKRAILNAVRKFDLTKVDDESETDDEII